MLRHSKPAAISEGSVNDPLLDQRKAEFQALVDAGQLLMREDIYPEYDLRYLLYALPGEAWRLDALHDLKKPFDVDEDIREDGRLLGYSEEQIEAAVKNRHLRETEPMTDAVKAEMEGLRPLIGPHEGRELELMLRGEKPAAMLYEAVGFDEWLQETLESFKPHVQSGCIVERIEFYPLGEHIIRYNYYALPGEKWRIERLHAKHLALGRSYEDELREEGRLLGYSPEEIEAEMQAWRESTKE